MSWYPSKVVSSSECLPGIAEALQCTQARSQDCVTSQMTRRGDWLKSIFVISDSEVSHAHQGPQRPLSGWRSTASFHPAATLSRRVNRLLRWNHRNGQRVAIAGLIAMQDGAALM